MESLKLSTNDFSGPLSDQLGNFRHLRLLALSNNSISGPIPVSLGNLSFLDEASISENHFNRTLTKSTGQLKMATVSHVKNIAGRDPINAIAECIPSSLHSGSGAKIKRLSTKQLGMPRPTWVHAGHMSGAKEDYRLKFHPIDSSESISKFSD
ncbi:unnamed protein product [Prunus armeniaca]